MTIPFYIQCLLMGLIGMASSILMIIKSLKAKAKVANLIFSIKDYFSDDWPTISLMAMAILVCWLLLPYAPKTWNQGVVVLIFGLAGYSGNDFISRIFSAMNKRFMAAIDSKTSVADQVNGTLDTPTPAVKPK